jgi:molybdate transport system substrate-binding protein
MVMRFRAAVLWLVFGALFTMPAAAAEVRVLAAASLKEAMDEQARRFEAASGDKVVVSYGASNALAKQIEAGSPADLFISADVDWMDYVDTRRLLAPRTRIDLLRNTLVLIAPSASPVQLDIAPGFALAQALDSGKLAMANPDSVPAASTASARWNRSAYGRASKRTVARAENVRAALVLVARGEAPLGIVYNTMRWPSAASRSSARSRQAVIHRSCTRPRCWQTANPPPRRSAECAAIAGRQRAIWEKYGFGVVQ